MATTALPRPSSERITSHGRGGAGNISTPRSPALQPSDLQTPHIKTAAYTTGRGGTGNIMSNDSADNARLAQDVEAPDHHHRRQREPENHSVHVGRGGAANIARLSLDNEAVEKSGGGGGAENEVAGNGAVRKDKGALERGREMLGNVLGRKGEAKK